MGTPASPNLGLIFKDLRECARLCNVIQIALPEHGPHGKGPIVGTAFGLSAPGAFGSFRFLPRLLVGLFGEVGVVCWLLQ